MNSSNIVRRFSALVVLLVVFYSMEWMQLRIVERNMIGRLLRISGYNTIEYMYEGSPALRVNEKLHYYGTECTYLDLVMTVAPFLWVFGAHRRVNLLRIGIVTLLILGGNLLRCWAAVWLDVLGVERLYAHDLPDYVIWWPTVVFAVVFALRGDIGRHKDAMSVRV